MKLKIKHQLDSKEVAAPSPKLGTADGLYLQSYILSVRIAAATRIAVTTRWGRTAIARWLVTTSVVLRSIGLALGLRQIDGAHARPYNRCSIGICYEGGLDEHGKPCNTMTAEQETRLVDLFRNLKILFPKAKIVGHRDLPGTTPKECPCLDVGSWALAFNNFE